MSDKQKEGSPKSAARRRKNARQLKRPPETMVVMLDRMLTSFVTVMIHGEAKEMPAIKAILLQLLQKAIAGSHAASRALVGYHHLANRHASGATELIFADDDYAREIASFNAEKKDV